MSQEVRASPGAKVYDEIALAGCTLNGTGPPDISIDPYVINATNYTVYIDTDNGLTYQKINGEWPSTPFIQVGDGGGGGIVDAVSLGGGESVLGVPAVDGVNLQTKSLTSNGGTVIITDNGVSLDFEVQNISGGVKNNFTSLRGPNFNDNLTDGYTPGSVWVNTAPDSGKKSFTCVRSDLTTAFWKPTSNELTFQLAVPTQNEDKNFGYLEGSVILTPDGSYVCVDDTVGQAKWAAYAGKEGEAKWEIRKELNPSLDEAYNIEFKNDGDAYKLKNNYNESNTNTTNPDAGFDKDAGYDVGSRYYTQKFGWDCVDSTNGSARWDSSLGMGENLNFNLATFDDDATYDYKLYFNGGKTVNQTAFVGSNFQSNRDPTALDSTTKGYDASSWWYNTILKKLWIYDSGIADWVWVNQGGSPPPPVDNNMNAANYGYLQGLSPTFNGPGVGNPIESTWYVPLRLGGGAGINATWQTFAGNQLPNNFVNANLASENLALQYTGPEGWFTISLFINAVVSGGGAQNEWFVTLWTDLVDNSQTVNFLNSDQAILENVETVSEVKKVGIVKSTFNKYLVPNEYIGLAVNASTANWVSTINTCSIAIIPLSLDLF